MNNISRNILFILMLMLVASCEGPLPSSDPTTTSIIPANTSTVPTTIPSAVVWNLEESMAMQGNITMDWINVEGFSPDASATIEIYEIKGGALSTQPFKVKTDQNGFGACDGFQFQLNLKPGMHIVATDDPSGLQRELTLDDIGIHTFDPDLDLVAGTAPPQAILLIRLHDEVLDEGREMKTIADESGNWLAHFRKEMDADINVNMNPQVLMFDQDQDATIAELTRSPYVEGNLPLDWIAASFFSPNASVTIEIYETEDGAMIDEPHLANTDWNGSATFEGSLIGMDLQPGVYLVVRDNINNELKKELMLVDLKIEEPDFMTNELSGFGPSDTWLTFELYDHNNGEKYTADVLSDRDGFWHLEFFDMFGVPLPVSDSTHIKLYDEDGDASVADPQ